MLYSLKVQNDGDNAECGTNRRARSEPSSRARSTLRAEELCRTSRTLRQVRVGVGLESHATSRTATLATRQRLSTQRPSTAVAVHTGLLRVHVSHTHRDGQHLDASRRQHFIYCRGRLLFVTPKCRDSTAGEVRVRRVLSRRHHLSRLLDSVSHVLLLLASCEQTFQQVIQFSHLICISSFILFFFNSLYLFLI